MNEDSRLAKEGAFPARFFIYALGILFAFVFGVWVGFHHLEKIHRNFDNWVACANIAAGVLAFSIKEFWVVRRCWRMWATLAGYIGLHFYLGVPALSGVLNRIGAGYVYVMIFLIAMPEMMLMSVVLRRATAKQTQSW